MIPWPLTPTVFAGSLVVAAALAFGAGWQTNGWRVGNRYEAKIAEIYRQGGEAMREGQKANNELRRKSREDADRIADLSRGVRVRCYADRPGNVSAAGPDADPAGDDREARRAAVDTTDVLRQCLRTFGEVNRTLSGVTP